jgi:hypothetical protein
MKIAFNNRGAHCYKNYYTKTVNKSGDNSFVFNPIPAIISAASPRETIPATTESKPFQENLANFAPNAAPGSFVNTAKHLMHYYPNMPGYAKKFDGSHDKKLTKTKDKFTMITNHFSYKKLVNYPFK